MEPSRPGQNHAESYLFSDPSKSTYICVILALVVLSFIPFFGDKRGKALPGVPIVGPQSWFEPLFITQCRFAMSGWSIVYEGYTKFKDSPFTIVRPESIVTVLPKRYVNELHNVPDTKLNPIQAIVGDLMGEYTNIDILLGSHLSPRAVQTKLTPRLGSFVGVIEDELNFAMDSDFPPCKDQWVTMDLNDVILRLVSRITARIFVGFPLCRNEEWLSLNTQIVEEIFRTVVIMRLFPPSFHRIISVCLLSRWRLQKCMQRIHTLLIPMINGRREKEAAEDESYEKPADVIQWMMDLANEKESPSENLATRYVYTIIGSMHTVTSAIKDTLYDICARPEYLEPLREELEQVLNEEEGWQKGTATKMRKLDSFMKEVQRLNPPSALGLKRVVREPIVLSDGLVLPKDTYICVVTTSHLQDDISPPGKFDGFRYFKKTQASGTDQYQYSSTDSEHIHFGHGRYACPGRFVASTEMKIILSRILLNYDMKFPRGQGRPGNMAILELSFQDPAGRIMLKQR